jgi:PBP1b-binding outer membrane lipoprotein LpoB
MKNLGVTLIASALLLSGCAMHPRDAYSVHTEVLVETHKALDGGRISAAEATYIFLQAGSAKELIDHAMTDQTSKQSPNDLILGKLILSNTLAYLKASEAGKAYRASP